MSSSQFLMLNSHLRSTCECKSFSQQIFFFWLLLLLFNFKLLKSPPIFHNTLWPSLNNCRFVKTVTHFSKLNFNKQLSCRWQTALNHDKRQNFKSHVIITMPLLLVICHPVARIDIAYLCTKFDDFRFSHSSDMIGAAKIFNGSHALNTPLSWTVCRPQTVTCTFNLYIKFGVFAINNYKDACIRQHKI